MSSVRGRFAQQEVGANLYSSMSNHKHFVQENGCFSDAQALYVEQFSCPVLEVEAKCF